MATASTADPPKERNERHNRIDTRQTPPTTLSTVRVGFLLSSGSPTGSHHKRHSEENIPHWIRFDLLSLGKIYGWLLVDFTEEQRVTKSLKPRQRLRRRHIELRIDVLIHSRQQLLTFRYDHFIDILWITFKSVEFSRFSMGDRFRNSSSDDFCRFQFRVTGFQFYFYRGFDAGQGKKNQGLRRRNSRNSDTGGDGTGLERVLVFFSFIRMYQFIFPSSDLPEPSTGGGRGEKAKTNRNEKKRKTIQDTRVNGFVSVSWRPAACSPGRWRTRTPCGDARGRSAGVATPRRRRRCRRRRRPPWPRLPVQALASVTIHKTSRKKMDTFFKGNGNKQNLQH